MDPSDNKDVDLSDILTFLNNSPLLFICTELIVPLTSNSYCGNAVLIPTLPPLIIDNTLFDLSYTLIISLLPFCFINKAISVPSLTTCNCSVLYVVVLSIFVPPINNKLEAVNVPLTYNELL